MHSKQARAGWLAGSCGVALLTISGSCASVSVDARQERGGRGHPAGVDVSPRNAVTFLATLYANDPITSSLSLTDGLGGGLIQDNMAKNRSNDLDYGGYHADALAVGMEGRRHGAIIDLGTREALREKYGYTDTVGGFQGFASIRRVGSGVVILQDYSAQTTQALTEAAALFGDAEIPSYAPVQLGHVYLIRILQGKDEALLAKLIVVAHEPEVSVTVRWELL